jgi:formamidopyrimidine-DNA glycosylase
MPEMPEVETMVERFQRWKGWRITDVEVDPEMTPAAAKKYLPEDEYNTVIGQAITGVYRRGKFIVITTSSGALLCHNAMSGYWDSTLEPWTFDYVEGARKPHDSDVRVDLKLESAKEVWYVRFHDARMFGSLRFVDPAALATKLSTIGPEVVGSTHLYEPKEVITAEEFGRALNKGKAVKELLMDQSRMAGLGNIYAAEALWYAGISPMRLGMTLSGAELHKLFEECGNVLNAAVIRKLNYDGLKIYRRKTCSRCKGPVTAEKLKGRTTHWCPACQK